MDTLLSLQLGVSAEVKDIIACGAERRRLQELGLIRGTEITPVMKSLFGDPIAYRFRGTVIALRNDDARKIII